MPASTAFHTHGHLEKTTQWLLLTVPLLKVQDCFKQLTPDICWHKPLWPVDDPATISIQAREEAISPPGPAEGPLPLMINRQSSDGYKPKSPFIGKVCKHTPSFACKMCCDWSKYPFWDSLTEPAGRQASALLICHRHTRFPWLAYL